MAVGRKRSFILPHQHTTASASQVTNVAVSAIFRRSTTSLPSILFVFSKSCSSVCVSASWLRRASPSCSVRGEEWRTDQALLTLNEKSRRIIFNRSHLQVPKHVNTCSAQGRGNRVVTRQLERSGRAPSKRLKFAVLGSKPSL